MAHVREGKIVEMRGMPDMLGPMQQIGAVSAPEQSEEASPTLPTGIDATRAYSPNCLAEVLPKVCMQGDAA